jgi:RHS repeat-associated protein
LARRVVRDPFRRQLVALVSNTVDTVAISAYDYEYDYLGRVTNRNDDAFGYNARSEVTAANVASNEYGYAYDNTGNHLFNTVNAVTNIYEVNALNQYTNITQFAESIRPVHDLDGNMISNGVWTYTWDAANQLTAAYFNSVCVVSNAYDHAGRRVLKVSHGGTETRRFVYDSWNLVQEAVTTASGTTTNVFVWGRDISGTMQGAGGVGGLLSVRQGNAWYFPLYDNNGNITAYIDEPGSVVAEYAYDAFGATITASGSMCDIFRHRFSTKYFDAETGLYYYGYRFYDPLLHRWLNRDPIEEKGGVNVYAFCGNDGVNTVDLLGFALYAFDGTWNDKDKMNRPTNVAKLYEIYTRRKSYKSGIGTSRLTRLIGGATGAGGKNRVKTMYKDLVTIYNTFDPTGDNQKIDVIGFSRGAALARDFVNYINEQGGVPITTRNGRKVVCPVTIRFLGLFDTVASFGIPGNDINLGYDLSIPGNVENVRHAIAQDEYRGMFPLTSVLDPNGANLDPRIVERPFRGAHSDVGGGYEVGDRSNFALNWMYHEAIRVGVPFGPLSPEDVGASDPVIHDTGGTGPRDIYYP